MFSAFWLLLFFFVIVGELNIRSVPSCDGHTLTLRFAVPPAVDEDAAHDHSDDHHHQHHRDEDDDGTQTLFFRNSCMCGD